MTRGVIPPKPGRVKAIGRKFSVAAAAYPVHRVRASATLAAPVAKRKMPCCERRWVIPSSVVRDAHCARVHAPLRPTEAESNATRGASC
jgi:hypothetical protein